MTQRLAIRYAHFIWRWEDSELKWETVCGTPSDQKGTEMVSVQSSRGQAPHRHPRMLAAHCAKLCAEVASLGSLEHQNSDGVHTLPGQTQCLRMISWLSGYSLSLSVIFSWCFYCKFNLFIRYGNIRYFPFRNWLCRHVPISSQIKHIDITFCIHERGMIFLLILAIVSSPIG